MDKDVIAKSKKLSYLLRHDKNGVYEPGGWRSVQELLQLTALSVEELINIVTEDSKGRYELLSDNSKIRALYGHSVAIDLQLVASQPPALLYHGTATRFIEKIRKEGLLSRSRQYVHLTEDMDTAVATGARHGEPIVLTIDASRLYDDGYKFFPLPNEVWLSGDIPINYIIFNEP